MHVSSISNIMGHVLLKYQCDFRKGFSTQNCLLVMLEKRKYAVETGKSVGVLLTDLSKTFNCLSHELLLAKLHAYVFRIHSILTNRRQRTKIYKSHSSWDEIVFGVPQESILEPSLFNIFLCDPFFMMKETAF